jgi:hypothetical protein
MRLLEDEAGVAGLPTGTPILLLETKALLHRQLYGRAPSSTAGCIHGQRVSSRRRAAGTG